MERGVAVGHPFHQQHVPHEQLQEQWDVAEQLGVGVAQATRQRVARQTPHADECA